MSSVFGQDQSGSDQPQEKPNEEAKEIKPYAGEASEEVSPYSLSDILFRPLEGRSLLEVDLTATYNAKVSIKNAVDTYVNGYLLNIGIGYAFFDTFLLAASLDLIPYRKTDWFFFDGDPNQSDIDRRLNSVSGSASYRIPPYLLDHWVIDISAYFMVELESDDSEDGTSQWQLSLLTGKKIGPLSIVLNAIGAFQSATKFNDGSELESFYILGVSPQIQYQLSSLLSLIAGVAYSTRSEQKLKPTNGFNQTFSALSTFSFSVALRFLLNDSSYLRVSYRYPLKASGEIKVIDGSVFDYELFGGHQVALGFSYLL